MVNFITTEQEFTQVLSSNNMVVVDFTASWCGPCKMIAPVFDDLSHRYPEIKCLKLDVDQVQSIAAAQGVTAMPTFIAYIQGKRVSEVRGADKNSLQQLMENTKSTYEAALRKKQDLNKPVDMTEEELMQMSIKELKRMIEERGWSAAGLLEKIDIVHKLRQGNE
jgi:thioredoxin 1